MANIQVSQPGGAGTLTADAVIAPNGRVYLSFVGSTTTWAWTMTSVPGGSTATVQNATSPNNAYFDPDKTNGVYALKFTDSGGNKYFINLATTTYRAAGAPGARIVLDAVDGADGDFNSNCVRDITLPEWTSGECVLEPFGGSTEAGAYKDGTLVIPTSGTGKISYLYVATATTMAQEWSFSEASSKAIKIAFVDSDLSSILSSTRPTGAPSEQVITLTRTGLTVGTLYKIQMEASDLSQGAQPVVGNVRLYPVNGTGIWAENFIRYRVNHAMLGGTSLRATYVNGQYLQHSGFAELKLLTDASSLTIEAWTDNAGLSGKVASLVNGREYQVGATLTTGQPMMDTHNFADANQGAVRDIGFRTDGHDNSSGALTANPKGVFFRALHAKQDANVIFRPSVGERKLYIWGTSIERGIGATTPLFGGWVHRLRRRFPGSVVVDAYTGRTFKTDGDTSAKYNALAAWIAQGNFTDVLLSMGPNDYVAALWSAATYGTNFAAFLDAIHAASPQTRVGTISLIAHTAGIGEGANGLGDTLANFNTQLSNGATNASRVSWSYYIDGKNAAMPQNGDLADGTHPNDLGHGKFGAFVSSSMATAGVL